jgi:hypothetical protein
MTVPDFSYLKTQQDTTPTPASTGEIPDFSYLSPVREGKGLFARLGNTLENLRTAMQAELALGIDPGIVDRVSPERREEITKVMGFINQARSEEPESVNIAIHDLQNFFNHLTTKGLGDKIGEVFDSIKEAGGGAFLKGIVAGMGQMAAAPLEMGAGVSLTEDDIRPLTPIERASRIKETAALALSVGAGIGARAVTRGALGVQAAKAGQIAKNALVGFSEGTVGGSVYGAVASANEEDQLAEILINGVIFAPLGAAFEAVGGSIAARRAEKKFIRERIEKETAGMLANIRRLEVDENSTIPQVAATVDALATEDDLAVVALRSRLTEEGVPSLMTVTGVKDFATLTKLAAEDDLKIAAHGDDALIYRPGFIDETGVGDFASTGHYKGEFVYYNGKEYAVKSVSNYTATLRDHAGADLVVDINLLRRSSKENLDVNALKAIEDEIVTVRKEAFDDMDDLDRGAIQQMEERVRTTQPTGVSDVANNNGMEAIQVEPGKWELRDTESGRRLGSFDDEEAAKAFINRTGQAKGIDLNDVIGGGDDVPPPDIGAPAMPPPNPNNPWEIPYQFARGKMDHIISAFNARVPWLTPYMSILTALDNRFGTQIFSRIYNPTQDASTISANAKISVTKRIRDEIEVFAKGISGGRREIIGQWLDAATPDELVKRGLKDGTLNSVEVKWAKRIGESDVDINKMFKYNKQVERAARDYPKSEGKRNARIKEAQEKLGLSKDDIVWHDRIFRSIGAEGGTIGPTIRLARAYANNSDSRALFAAKNKMTAQELRVGLEVERLFNELAQEFGVGDIRMLSFFQSNAKLYNQGVLSDALRFFDRIPKQAKDFYNAIQQTGELNPYEKDPIFALQRYATAGYDARHLSDAVHTARNALEEEILKVPDGAREEFRKLVTRYLNDVRGIPPASSRMTQTVVDGIAEDLKLNLEIDTKRHITDAIITTISSSFQALRIKYGIMDFTTGTAAHFSRFGSARTGKMWNYGAKGLDGVTREELIRRGVVKELTPVLLADLVEYGASSRTASKLGQTYNAAVSIGFQATGQKKIYEMLQAGTYLETWQHTGSWLRKLNAKEVSKAKAYKEMKIDTYDLAAGQHFDALVTASKFEEAADFLGKQAIREVVGVYQQANAPYGWNTNTGRLIGQFGRFPAWIGAYTRRLASRGTRAQRAANMMRFAAANAAIYGAGAAIGANLWNWMPATGMLFSGGPGLGIMQTAVEALSGYGGEQELAQSRLRKYLLYDPISERWNIGQPYLPGSFFINDLVKASQVEDGLEMLTTGLGLPSLNR